MNCANCLCHFAVPCLLAQGVRVFFERVAGGWRVFLDALARMG